MFHVTIFQQVFTNLCAITSLPPLLRYSVEVPGKIYQPTSLSVLNDYSGRTLARKGKTQVEIGQDFNHQFPFVLPENLKLNPNRFVDLTCVLKDNVEKSKNNVKRKVNSKRKTVNVHARKISSASKNLKTVTLKKHINENQEPVISNDQEPMTIDEHLTMCEHQQDEVDLQKSFMSAFCICQTQHKDKHEEKKASNAQLEYVAENMAKEV